jgi:predicted glycosyltransferase
MRVFFYVQHLLGIGHLKRAAALAQALRRAGFEVALASGGFPVQGVEVSYQLPPARAADASFKVLVDEAGRPIDDEWKRRRAALLLDAWRAVRADVLLIELYPFGRRQMRFELVPLLEDARRLQPRARVVCSVRDLIQPKPAREAETLDLVERYFDRVLVHGDPAVARFERSFAPAARLGERLVYTGYVVAEAPPPAHGARGEVLVSAGGGAVGARLLETALRARELSLMKSAPWRVLAGVQADEGELAALRQSAPAGVTVERSRDDFQALLAGCALSISQAGYNTVAEVLQARVRAVLVPFAGGSESEQSERAELLAAHGACQVVPEARLTPLALAAAVDRAARTPRPEAGRVDLGGAARTAELIRKWLA